MERQRYKGMNSGKDGKTDIQGNTRMERQIVRETERQRERNIRAPKLKLRLKPICSASSLYNKLKPK
jgi:hypothetical protein